MDRQTDGATDGQVDWRTDWWSNGHTLLYAEMHLKTVAQRQKMVSSTLALLSQSSMVAFHVSKCTNIQIFLGSTGLDSPSGPHQSKLFLTTRFKSPRRKEAGDE